MTRSPGLNCATPSPIATISPAASLPGTNGGSGRNWYLPASISTSTYCTPRAPILTCTSPGPGGGGSGTSRRASTSGPPNASHTTAFIAASLSPIVEHKEPGPAVTGLVWPMHRDALNLRAKAAREHRPVGFFARRVDAGDDGRHAGRKSQRGAGVEQCREAVLGAGSGTHRAEFDETDAVAGLALRPQMADREAGEFAVAVPQQYHVAELARGERADLAPKIEPVIELFGQFSRGTLHVSALALR